MVNFQTISTLFELFIDMETFLNLKKNFFRKIFIKGLLFIDDIGNFNRRCKIIFSTFIKKKKKTVKFCDL